MKMVKKIVLTLALNVLVFSPLTHADIIIQSPSMALENVCDNASGIWSGAGVVSYKILGKKITCQYKGVANVMPTDTQYNYKFDVDLTLISGNCPEHDKEVLYGSCNPTSGSLVLKSKNANLSGTVSPDGKSASLTGKVSIKGKEATVEKMELNKQ